MQFAQTGQGTRAHKLDQYKMAIKGKHVYRHNVRHELKLTRRLVVNRWRYFTKPKLIKKILRLAKKISRLINKN